jgi:sigma-54 dependent transcriptional regulator, acetoin dehydrogenase operon transcriptional activator AcoR
MAPMDTDRTITRTDGHRSRQKRSSYLFLVLRCDRPLEPGARLCLDGFDAVELGRGDELRVDTASEGGAKVLRIGIPDPRVSASHARLEKVLGSWMLEDRKSKNGTLLDGQHTSRSSLAAGALLELGHTFFLYREEPSEKGTGQLDGKDLKPQTSRLATFSPALAAEFERVALVARSRITVLLQGETGTGKEVVARAIHELSGRPGPFVAVNCGALPQGLVEAELFGYRRGSFTGAAEDRPGLVRSSDHGTLLLDEIGDLPMSEQATLLRVLQEEEVHPVAAQYHPVKVDLRVIAATHRDLEKLCHEEKFRPDLLARLCGIAVHLPALRDRREDLGLLVAAILRRQAGGGAADISFTPEAARALLLHPWPRNVRELEKALEGAVVLARAGRIDLEHLPPEVGSASLGRSVRKPPDAPAPPVDENNRKLYDELVAKLGEYQGNITETARAMGKARTQVQRWMRRYNLDAHSFRR